MVMLMDVAESDVCGCVMLGGGSRECLMRRTCLERDGSCDLSVSHYTPKRVAPEEAGHGAVVFVERSRLSDCAMPAELQR